MGRGTSKGSYADEVLIRTGLRTTLDDLAKQVAESESLRGNFIAASGKAP